MNWQIIFRVIGIAGFVTWALVERWFSLQKQNQSNGKKADQGSYWMINLFWYGAIFFSFIDAGNLNWTTISSSFAFISIIGVILVVLGITIRILARRALGKQYSVFVETSQEHQLVTQGIFSVIRHPAYLGLICLLVGIPLCAGSWGGVLIGMAGGIPAIIARIRIEEEALNAWFANDYQQYKTRTWRLIPGLW